MTRAGGIRPRSVGRWVHASECAPAVTDPATLAANAQTALNQYCGSCHGPQAPEALGAIGYINDLQKLVDKKKVKRGTADDQKKSRVLVRMYDTESPMPPAWGRLSVHGPTA